MGEPTPAAQTTAQTPPGRDTLLQNPFTREFWLGQVDLRPVSLMRILLGAMVLWDLFRRSEELVAWHTDLGVLPRAALVEGIARPWRLSLLDMMGTPGMVVTFFGLSAVAALCLTVGFKTRLATVLTWMAVVSLQERNLGVTDSSDTLLRVMLFWMIFAPAGAAYSLDAALARPRDTNDDATRAWPPMGSAVGFRFMQMELVILYFVTCVTKNGEHWRDGSAMYRALQVWDFARPTATFYVDNLGMLARPMAYAALVMEFCIAAFLWLPNLKVRRVLLLCATGFHLSIEFFMNVGMFSLMLPMCYTLFLWPGALAFVDRHAPRFDGVVRLARRVGLDLLANPPNPLWVGQRINRRIFVGLAVMMATIVWDQGHEMNNRFPRPPEPFVAVMESLSLWQNWRMFAPNPVFDSGPWVGEGVLADGTPVDPLAVAIPEFASPPPGRIIYTRWNKFRLHVRTPEQRGYLLWLGRYICRQWGLQRPNTPPLDKFKLVYQMQRSHAPWDPVVPVQPTVMWKHYCIKVPDKEDAW